MTRIAVATLLVACADPGPAPIDAAPPDAGSLDGAAFDGGSLDGGPPPPVAVYSEFLAYDALSASLPDLGRRGAALSVAVQSARIGEPALAALLRDAERENVEVRLWLLLSIDEGYWPNETNVDAFAAQVTRLLDWLDTEGLGAAGVVYDLEPPYAYSEELRAALATDLAGAVELMRAHVDRAAFESARAALSAHVADVQSRGYRAIAVTYPQVIDDLADGDDDLQDALDVPVRGVGFDEVSFMVYQTVIAESSGGAWIGPGLVRSFALDARAGFGARASIALGIVGSASIVPISGPLYDGPATLAEDCAAAYGAGIGRVEVYSLDGMVELGDVPGWLDATSAAPSVVPIPAGARIVRGAAAGLDETLDAP